jgi:hypothetical protein
MYPSRIGSRKTPQEFREAVAPIHRTSHKDWGDVSLRALSNVEITAVLFQIGPQRADS